MGKLKRTRSSARRLQLLIAAMVMAGSVLACSQGYMTPYELTMTARAVTPAATQPLLKATNTEIPSATPITETPLPTFTELPNITVTAKATNTFDPLATSKPPIIYYTQSGDTLPSITGRFNVNASEILSSEALPKTGLINPGIMLTIPDRLDNKTPYLLAMPDSEVVYSPSASDFDIEGYISKANGYLAHYSERVASNILSGAEIVKLVALENSCNPRLLLAILEYQSHWVLGKPTNLAQIDYPMGYVKLEKRGLYYQLSWAVEQLSIGYYGWRAGNITEVTFKDNTVMHLDPQLNAGTVALQYLFAQWYGPLEWNGALYGDQSMPVLMQSMFGDFWARSKTIEPLYPTNLSQPTLELPFISGKVWTFTGGPHPAWGPGGALAAVDFAPPTMTSGCVQSDEWVTAMAPGLVVRTGDGVVIEDLDGDGNESTGWVIMYLHIETRDRVDLGTVLKTNDLIGHPSCEGGLAAGTHVHVARKFNGEWMLAGGPVPFDLSGFVVINGDAAYDGTMSNGTVIVTASPVSASGSMIAKP
jgi:LasA protease